MAKVKPKMKMPDKVKGKDAEVEKDVSWMNKMAKGKKKAKK